MGGYVVVVSGGHQSARGKGSGGGGSGAGKGWGIRAMEGT